MGGSESVEKVNEIINEVSMAMDIKMEMNQSIVNKSTQTIMTESNIDTAI